MSTGPTDLCRVVLVTPHRTVEMALPGRVPLADLMPVLVQRATTAGLADRPGRSRPRGLTGDGDWVLQRLGGAPLEEDMTPAALEIRDGETLYLRPRDSQLPPAHFDDLIDGLATGVSTRHDRWREPMTRALFLVICVVALGVGYALLLGAAFPDRAVVAGVVALTLVIGAMLCSRSLGDGWAALTLGISAVPYAALMGVLVPPGPGTIVWAAPNLLCALVAATVTALVVSFGVGGRRAVLLAMWLAGLAGSLGALLMVLDLSVTQAAGTVLTLVLMASIYAPSVAFRLARLRLPQLPTGAADLSEDIEPYPGPELLAGAIRADSYLTWLFVAVGTVCTACIPLLLSQDDARARGLAAAVCFVFLIRSRGLTSGWQRASALVPALLGLALLVLHYGGHPDPDNRIVAVAAMVGTAATMLALSRAMPGRRLLPYWGRIADIVEYVFAIAMVLLLLWLFDVYQWARALNG